MALKADLDALKKLSRAATSDADLEPLIDAVNNQSDQSAALVCAALLEEATIQFLAKHMVALTNQEYGELFRGVGALSAQSARIKLCYAIGLIGPITRTNLDIIRDVRNEFAHGRKNAQFTTPAIANVVRHLKIKEQIVPYSTVGPLDNIKGPRMQYVAVSMLIRGAMVSPGSTRSLGFPPALLP